MLLLLLFASLGAYSQACNCPPVATCGPCQGGLTRLTFKYDDPAFLPLPALVTVTDGGGVIFSGVIADGGTFEVTANIEGNLFIGNSITVSSILSTESISTGCGTPIFAGDSFGYYSVVAGRSQSGLAICCATEDMETNPPTILNCPSNITTSLSSNSCTKVVSWVPPSVSDDCGVESFTSTRVIGHAFPVGLTVVTYTATDKYGNTSTCSFNVQVNDITPPILTACPTTITLNADATAGSCGTNVSWTPPNVSDNCTVNLTSNKTPGQFFSVGTTPVTYTATDAGGNQVTCTFNVIVNDFTNPTIINCPTTVSADASSIAGTCGAHVTWTPPTAIDNCVVNITASKNPGDFFSVGTTPVTYTATDASGRQATCTFNVVVTDVTNPVFSGCPSTITVNADATIGTCGTNVTWTPPTVTDNCVVNMVSNKTPGQFFAVGTTAVTYTATDASGRQSTCTFNVVVNDATNPIIAGCPTPITVNADVAAGTCGTTVTWTPPTASDNCAVTMTSNKTPGQFFSVGTTAVTYTATDASGRQSTCTFNVVVNDITNPIITGCPTTITINADASAGTCGTNVTWTPPTVTDNCLVTMSSNKTSGQFFSVGTTTVTYTATDASGRQSTCSFDVVVNDVTSPVITGCPTTINVNAVATTGTCGTTVTWNPPTATDNCAVTMTSNKTPGQFFAVGTTAVTYIATDASGRQSTCTFNVVVTDATNPVIIGCPTTITVNASSTIGTCGTNVTWTPPTASDNCAVTMTSDKTPGQFFPVGTTAVTYMATDASGRQSACTFNVIVNDVTNPIISGCPSTFTVNANSAAGSCGTNVTWTPPTAADNCTVSMTSNKTPGQFFVVGTTAVTYTATDASGRTATCTFNVIVNDLNNPVISNCPSTITVNALSTAGTCGTTATWTPPTVTDNCAVTMTSNKSPGDFFAVGTTAVTYTATDASGRTATCTFNVVINDITNPVISGCPTTITVSAGTTAGTCGTNVSWTPPAFNDNCSLVVTSNRQPGDAFPLGTTTVTYTATDPAGNTRTCSFNVVVNDVTAPIISDCPSDITVNAGANCNAVASWTAPTFTDNCSATIAGSHTSGQTFPLGHTVVTYTVTDVAGNQSTCSFNVVVNDTSAPIIANCPADIAVSADIGQCGKAVTWIAPIAADNCTVTLTSNFSPGHLFAEGTTVVSYSATDGSGNITTCSFNVTVSDATAPVVTNCPTDLEVDASSACSASVIWTAPSFTDNCGSVIVTSSHNPNDVFPVGVTSVTYAGTDASGNSTICVFKITVVDRTSPVINNCPANISVSTLTGCGAVVSWAVPVATDNCHATLTSTHQPGSIFNFGTTRVTYTAKDAADNQASCFFDVTVIDGTKPVFSKCPADLRIAAPSSSCAATATWTTPEVTDCSAFELTATHDPGAMFSVGTTEVTYTATDANGNSSTCIFNVVVEDVTAPVFSNCPAEISVNASTNCDGIATWTDPLANDVCGVASLTSSHHSGDVFPLGITKVVYTATDVNGNIAKCEFNVIVRNKNAPIIVDCPADQVVKVVYEDFASATWIPPTATVICGEVSITSSHVPGSEFPVGETVVEYSATDDAGNTSKCTFKIRVEYENLDFTITKLVTPDGDGINDMWMVPNIEKFRDNKVTVFDRWGGVIYTATGYDNQNTVWTGVSSAGGEIPTGTYFYTITVRYRGDYVERKGFIELVR